ncbi:LysR family transcriptional regulator [Caballeronia sp. LZ034LL]|uniref:LysR family transcriptional regulator n=1 Tax=Caballeronia sp. LZ034LL TaxID=3038567 RepID=UPI00285DE543|nr:LysR family transcriptional regulator [Caballeronia sp. LZ034LL]MDR5839405.1 LysR family transcriptional regulator [Caballeronia sp. LZ034LL]
MSERSAVKHPVAKRPDFSERDLRSLRIFCSVAQANGFAAAEKQLNMSKASISRHIREVEDTLGARLCERGPSGFVLTHAGKVALELARDALMSLARIRPEIDAVRGVLSGTLAIGMVEHIVSDEGCHLPEALASLKELAPDVSVELRVMTFNELDLALRERRVQVAIRGMYRREAGFHYLPLFIERQQLYVARRSLRDAAALPLVYRSQPFVHEMLNTLGMARGPSASGLEAVAMLVLSGHYVGLLPQFYAASFAKRQSLVKVPGVPVYENTISAITEISRPRTRALDLFLDLLQQLHDSA